MKRGVLVAVHGCNHGTSKKGIEGEIYYKDVIALSGLIFFRFKQSNLPFEVLPVNSPEWSLLLLELAVDFQEPEKGLNAMAAEDKRHRFVYAKASTSSRPKPSSNQSAGNLRHGVGLHGRLHGFPSLYSSLFIETMYAPIFLFLCHNYEVLICSLRGFVINPYLNPIEQHCRSSFFAKEARDWI